MPRARAAGNARGAPAQLAREPDRRTRPERRSRKLGRARVRRRARDGARRDAGGARRCTAQRPRRADRIHRVSDVLRDGGRRRGLRRGCARRGRRARGRLRLGCAFRISPVAARVAAPARRGRDHRLHAQDRRQPHAVGDAARRAHRPHRHRRGRPRGSARTLDQPELAADGVTRRDSPAPDGPRRGAAGTHDRRGGAALAMRSTRSPDARSWGRGSSAGPASPAGIRCGS